MRRQLCVQQVGHMQVHQLQTHQRLQAALDFGQPVVKRGPCAGDPEEPLRGQLGGQRRQFLRAAAVDVKNAHGVARA